MKTRNFFRIAGIFLSVLCIMAFACKNPGPADDPSSGITPEGENPVLVERIDINGGNITLKTGTGASLSVSVSPENADNKTVIWTSNSGAVTVDKDTGEVSAKKAGSAIVRATAADDSGVYSEITVTVTNEAPPRVERITINEGDELALIVGEGKKLSVTVLPDNAGNKNVTWASDDPQKVEVLNQTGDIKALREGTAVITATAQDGSGVRGALTVTVTAPEEPAVPMTPQEIFASLKGQKITTNGWADRANAGAGLSYANPASLTLIDDAFYPDAKAKREAFTNAVNSDSAKFIIVSGDIDLGDGVISDTDKSYFNAFDPVTHKRLHGDIRFNVGSNTTIIGINNARLMFGGLNINNKTNIIIRNITFYDAHGSTEEDTQFNVDSKASIDALTVQGTSEGVWVDHCKFTDGTCEDLSRNYNHDGAFDIPRGKYITVSWCEFTNHDKVMLVAGSDSAANAVADQRQITLHHIYFHGTTQRMPRTRGTQMHVYNNYYNDIGNPDNNGSFMGPGWGAEFIVENNYFGSKTGKTIEWFDTNPSTYPVKFYYSGNNKADSDTAWWGRASNPKPWEPAYQYAPEPNAGLPTSIPAGAGPKLVFTK